MQISIVSLFPEYFESSSKSALLGRALSRGLLTLSYYNPRDFAEDARKTVDGSPYGGGVGMVLSLPPLDACLASIPKRGRTLLFSASGRPFTQSYAEELSKEETLTFICGRYEGIDYRLNTLYEDIEEVSIGDFIVNGGEVGALVLLESIGRLLPSFMGKIESGSEESFVDNLLEYPQYTRPQEYKGVAVPSILLSGDHAKINQFRRKEQLKKTLNNRADLLQNALLSKEDRAYIESIIPPRISKNLYIALVHYPVLSKSGKSIAVSLTNLDIHDIARCACTYGLGGYYITTPLEEQKSICSRIVSHWTEGVGGVHNQDRSKAMKYVQVFDTISDVIDDIILSIGKRPYIFATSAKGEPTLAYSNVRDILVSEAVLLLFGTSHGLAPEVYDIVDGILPPIRYIGGYNHLSVRSAVAISIDRILGDFF